MLRELSDIYAALRIAIVTSMLFVLFVLIFPATAFSDDRSQLRPPENLAPLVDLLNVVEKSYKGKILEVEVEQEEIENRKIWIYEVKLLTRKGKVFELEYNATTLELMNTEH